MKRSIISILLVFVMVMGITAYSEPITEYVEINGHKYKQKQNVITYLFIGVDDPDTVDEKESYDGSGQADTLLLLVIDKAKDTYAVIAINRDTICDVHSISVNGKDLGAYPVQIALAHANGDGLDQSCINTATAVSDLLCGISIDKYMSLNMDAIGIVNNLAGGVEVTIEDEFGNTALGLVKGETVVLSDEQAVAFVRGRMDVGDGTNENRMKRQRQYLEALKPKLLAKYEADESYVNTFVDTLKDYTVTNMTDKDFSYIAKAIMKNEDLGIFEFDGISEMDEYGFNAFYPDEESILQVVTTLFYIDMEN